MGKLIDLTGQRFGKLTVLAPAENIGSLTAFRATPAKGYLGRGVCGHL